MKTIFRVPEPIRTAPIKKLNRYIEIVGSTNPRLNAMTEDSRFTIHTVLSKYYTNVGVTIVNDIDDLEKLVAKKPDLVVLGMKLILLDPSKSYDDSPKLWLSTYLTEHGIAFTGSDTEALALEFDKHEAKQVVLDAGLNSSLYFISTINNPTFQHSLRFPLFVKPTNRGDSKGIDEMSVVTTNKELRSKIESIHSQYGSDALIEEYLPGREFSVAVIKQPFVDQFLMMPIEITTPVDSNGNSFLSSKVKTADLEKVVAIKDPHLAEIVNGLALGVFKALGARDYGRIDMRLDGDGQPNFIEANLMPGLSNHGYLYRCFKLNRQVNYENMIVAIARLGLERVANQSRRQLMVST